MNLRINRRSFLNALIAAGASYTLPVNASEIQINQIWEIARTNPWFFEVDEHGTLIDENVKIPAVWEDIYRGTNFNFTNVESLVSKVENCSPLSSFLNLKLQVEIQKIQEDLKLTNQDTAQNIVTELQVKLITLKGFIDEYEEPCLSWIELAGDAGINLFNQLGAEWLQESVDWEQSEIFPKETHAQGAALTFFQSLSEELLMELGVVIIYGEHPGSSYYAAELKKDIETANNLTLQLGLPFRFKTQN